MTHPTIKDAVNRFLGWRLPEDFSPDCGIVFDQRDPTHISWPTGTNLFTADQATKMFERCLPEPDLYDAVRLQRAEEEVQKLKAQLAAVPVSTDDAYAARCWRYFSEYHPRQIAAALNCGDYEIDSVMRDSLPAAAVTTATPEQKACASLLEYLWQHGYMKRDDAMLFDKRYGDGTVGKET